MSFTPTLEQLAIVEAAVSSSDNLLIEALAGAAKTSTLVLIAEALPGERILSLAFNKRIATEMTARLPSNCEAKTLNGLGHGVWADAIGRRLTIDTGKVYKILSTLIAKLPKDLQSAAYAALAELIQAVSFGKACGYVPAGVDKMKRLMDDGEFFSHLEEELEPWKQELIAEASAISIKQAWQGLCDFDDQILMPTLATGVFPRYPLVLIDEAQDLSALNHAMLQKLVKKRIIAVGDSAQAIYGFRGAHQDSMSLLAQQFTMKRLSLTISFRCPRAVVEAARFRAPMMRYPEWAIEGEVAHLGEWTPATIPDYASVLCRNNSPLFSVAIKLLKAGRYPELIGNDIGKGLLKIMSKFGPPKMPKADVLSAIETWRSEKLEKSRAIASVNDKADCLIIFASMGDNLGEAIAYAEHIFASSGPIKLMTVHKAKGLEFDDVFFLDHQLIGKEKQEPNLRYVAITRAKKRLTYIRSDDFRA